MLQIGICDDDFAFIVNINYVAEFQPDSIILLNGISLPVSRSYQKEIQQKFLKMNMQRRWYK